MTNKTNIPTIDVLYQEVSDIIIGARNTVYRAANTEMVQAYWHIGKKIIEEEQKGNERAAYGKAVIKELANRLSQVYGANYSQRNLWYMKQFYQQFKNVNAVRSQLSWTHYRLLLKVEDEAARTFYINETITANWSTRTLDRQISNLYYQRMLLSKDKTLVKEEAIEKQIALQPKDIIKDPEGGGNVWFESKTTTNLLTLWDLKAGTTYEYQITKSCGITQSDWSFSKQFTTHIADDEESVYECGVQPDFNITNQDPLQTIGDKFTAGDFPIKVLEVSGSDGRFTGKGYVTIPYLSSIKVGVEFTNVLINTDNQLVEGSVITMYDPSLSNILDIDEAIDTVTDVVDAVGELADAIEVALNLDITRDTKQKVNQIVDAIVTNIKNEDLPENLQSDIETAANQMKDAKERYDEAIANGDAGSAQTAQNDFIAAQNNLEEAQKEVNKYKDEVADLLKEAILDLYREGREMETVLISEYQTIIEERKNVLNDLGNIIFLDNELIEEREISISLINKDQENLNTAESKIATYLFAQLLSQEDADNQKLEFYLEELEKMDIKITIEIENLRKENKDKQEIIDFLKEELKRSFTLILLNGLPKF